MTILGLGPGALKADAKRAFRELAKKYHPDRRGLGQSSGQADARMKDINAAFYYLYPLLQAGPGCVEPENEKKTDTVPGANPAPGNRQKSVLKKKEPVSKESILRQVLTGLGKRVKAAHYKKTSPAQASYKPSMPSAKPRPPMGINKRKISNFESVLKAQCPGLKEEGQAFAGSRRSCTGHSGAVSYSEYAARKSRMALARKKSAGTAIGRVEKIQPISRIKPVGKI